MKKILTVLLIALTTLVCNANTPVKDCNTLKKVNDTQIPETVKKWLKNELSNTTTTVLENFETPAFFTKRKSKIIGYIKGYDQTLGAKTGMFYYTNELTGENKPRIIEIHKDGRFELELPLEYPMHNYFAIKSQVINFYLEPGQNLSVILNWEDIKQPRRISLPLKNVTYEGPLQQINTDLLHYKPNYSGGNFQKKEAIMEPLAFKEYMLQFKDNALNKVKAYEQSGEIDKKTSELLRNDIILQTYYSLFDYYSPTYSPRYGQGKRKANNIDDTLPENYYDFIKDLPLHKQSILVNQNFGSFINRLEYSAPLQFKKKGRIITTTNVFSKKFLEYLVNKNITVSAEDKKLIDTFKEERSIKKVRSKELQVKLNAFYKKHELLVKEFLSADGIDNQRKNYYGKELKERDSLAVSIGIKNNLIYEIIKSRALKFELRQYSNKKNKAWHWAEVKKDIKSPHLIKLGDDLLEREKEKPEFYKLPENETGTNILKKLIAPYKDKIVIVQFWEPYSYYQGEGLERSKKRRKKFINNENIIFLFITSETSSPIEKYNSSLEKNGFENSIRIPQDDYNYMRQLFEFNASVHDILVKQDGETVYNDFETWNMEYFLSKEFNIKPEN